jgi:hypothetical protein
MSTIVFENGDQPYLEWISKNPTGYVLNLFRSRRGRYYVLHRPKCHTISNTSGADGKFTSNTYIKVCAMNIKDLEKWMTNHHHDYTMDMRRCGHCNPT